MSKKITVCIVKNNIVTDQIDYNVPLANYDYVCDIFRADNKCDPDCEDCIIQKLYSITQTS